MGRKAKMKTAKRLKTQTIESQAAWPVGRADLDLSSSVAIATMMNNNTKLMAQYMQSVGANRTTVLRSLLSEFRMDVALPFHELKERFSSIEMLATYGSLGPFYAAVAELELRQAALLWISQKMSIGSSIRSEIETLSFVTLGRLLSAGFSSEFARWPGQDRPEIQNLRLAFIMGRLGVAICDAAQTYQAIHWGHVIYLDDRVCAFILDNGAGEFAISTRRSSTALWSYEPSDVPIPVSSLRKLKGAIQSYGKPLSGQLTHPRSYDLAKYLGFNIAGSLASY